MKCERLLWAEVQALGLISGQKESREADQGYTGEE
jgi:hypothetical protein